jgi:hypothetical protein
VSFRESVLLTEVLIHRVRGLFLEDQERGVTFGEPDREKNQGLAVESDWDISEMGMELYNDSLPFFYGERLVVLQCI